ncbi:hypothetical protein GCK72_017817 [Caenorhabditis remanei]|uniref:Accumulation-associated protein n=1 Tax=Caenorhabditis remanei TaxID=31234 RepID=A0A6A5G988_CAERE|nr:hypothetical protein GCK72_017817 [Caenorhabditis remanei]KAF1751263.1 hypothetical protein GCK72_017817 [Caenorhabditis remanei]
MVSSLMTPVSWLPTTSSSMMGLFSKLEIPPAAQVYAAGTVGTSFNNLFVIFANFYGTVATFALLFTHSPYRNFIRQCCRLEKRKNTTTGKISISGNRPSVFAAARAGHGQYPASGPGAASSPRVPGVPFFPGGPGGPGRPAFPGFPDSPSFPGAPGCPAGPASPRGPGGPGRPGCPGLYSVPGSPRGPAGPGLPGFPGLPESPPSPGAPGPPGGPGGPLRPLSPDGPAGPTSPGGPRGPGRPGGH